MHQMMQAAIWQRIFSKRGDARKKSQCAVKVAKGFTKSAIGGRY